MLSDQVRVRMYRQGLGDCFLLTFPKRDGECHVLIDCGVLTGTEDAEKKMRKVAQNVFETTNKHLDVLVVTHEHWDHVSGFLQAEDIFKKLKIGQVWLAWTEDPTDDLAGQLADRKVSALRDVVAAFQQLDGVEDMGARRIASRLSGLLSFDGGFDVARRKAGVPAWAWTDGARRKTTVTGMDWVKKRHQPGQPFLRPGDAPMSLPEVDVVRVYVLGPPRDWKMLRKSRPSKRDSEVYELAEEGGVELGFLAAAEPKSDAHRPFDEWFRLDVDPSLPWDDRAPGADSFFTEHYWNDEEDWRRIEHDSLRIAEQLALRLDAHTNNTSLVLAFELCESGKVLLFTGDAQVGNWLSWEGLFWEISDGDGTRTVTTRDLLSRTVLYKVGHHGSHNATLRDKGLELMSSDELVAMVPVDRDMAKRRDWKMPFPSLLQRLHEKTKGRIIEQQAGISEEKPEDLTPEQWKHFSEVQVEVHEDWIDFFIEL